MQTRLRILAPIAAAILVAAPTLAPRATRAAAQPAPLVEPMVRLSAQTEDALHWLVRDDFTRLQHVSIEMVRTIDHLLGIAQSQGLAPQVVDQYLAMREYAEDLGEEAKKGDLDEAGEEYVDLVETCLKCHVGLP